MSYPAANTIELLEAIEQAHVAVKRLRSAVTLCGNLELGAACDMPALDLSENLAALERIIACSQKQQKNLLALAVLKLSA